MHPNNNTTYRNTRDTDEQNPRINFLKDNWHLIWAILAGLALVFFLVLAPARLRADLYRGLSSQRDLAGMLFFFGLLMMSVLWSVGHSLDALVFLFFNIRGRRPFWLDKLMFAYTQLGNGLAAFLLAGLAYGSGAHRLAYEIVLGTLSLGIVVELVKAITRRARPFVHLTQARIVGWRERGRSFPSGHTSQTFFLTTLLIQHFHLNLWPALGLYLAAVLVGVTRMYVGAHYPRDVLAGALLGSTWGLIGTIIDVYITARI